MNKTCQSITMSSKQNFSRPASNRRLIHREAEIDNMSPELVLSELKNKGLQAFGTARERKERLKKYYGINSNPLVLSQDQNESFNKMVIPMKPQKRKNLLETMEEMKNKREMRRKRMQDQRLEKMEREAQNIVAGKMGDVDFEMMIDKYRLNIAKMTPHIIPDSLKINVCVRKRPLFVKEIKSGELDCVTVVNPKIFVHDCKYKVDGITKYLDNQSFTFDNV